MRRPYSLPLVVSFTVAVLLLAACSGSRDESSDTTLAPTTTEQATTTTTASTTTAATTTTESATSSVETAVDNLYLAFEAADPITAVALFDEDGVWVDKFGGEWVGSAGVADYVERVGPGVSRCVRVGAAEPHDDGSFTFPIEFTYNGVDYQEDAAVTMADGLITRHDWATGP